MTLPTMHDRTRIAAKAVLTERTVRRVYQGLGNHYSRLRVAQTAQELGLPEPPLAESSNSSPSSSPESSKNA